MMTVIAHQDVPGGLWIRIRKRFGPRMMEWFFSWIAMAWGGVLLLPDDTFAGPSWVYFRKIWTTETSLGMVMVGIGIARFTALIVNGSRKDVTPWIRVVAAGAGFMTWVFISTCFAMSGTIGPWIAIYPSFAIAEIVNIIRAGSDVGENNDHVANRKRSIDRAS